MERLKFIYAMFQMTLESFFFALMSPFDLKQYILFYFKSKHHEAGIFQSLSLQSMFVEECYGTNEGDDKNMLLPAGMLL